MIDHYGLDTETRTFGAGKMAPKIVCMSAYRPGVLAPTLYGKHEIEAVFEQMLDSGLPLVFYNAAFDCTVLMANYPRLTSKIFAAYTRGQIKCTLIRETLHLLALGELGRQRGLLSLASTYMRRTGKFLEGKKEGEDSVRYRFAEVEDLPPEKWPREFRDYALKDAIVNSDIFTQQEELPDEERQTRAAFALNLMAATGFRADGERTRKLRAQLEARVARAALTLVPAGLVRPAGSKNMKAIRAEVERQYLLYLKAEAPKSKSKESARKRAEREARGKEKKPPGTSTAWDTLNELPCLDEHGCPCTRDEDKCKEADFRTCRNPLHVLMYRNEDAGEISKYIPHLEMAARTPVNFRVTSIMETGRISISEPPLQQLPRRPGIRQCIVPPDGHVFIGADYSAIELVTLAQILLDMFGESKLADTLRAGRDPHSVTGALLAGVSYEEFIAGLESKDRELKKKYKYFRQFAKALNFGVPGGLGGETFLEYLRGYDIRLDGTKEEQLEQSRGYIRKYKEWYPEIRRYLDLISEQCGQHGGAFTMAQPRSKRIRGNVLYTSAANSTFQGLASDLAKDALWRIAMECYLPELQSPLFGSRIVLFMHDEIIAQSPEPLASEAGERLGFLMRSAGSDWCPDVPVKASPWIARWWDKDAETVRNDNGELQVWMPEEDAA